MRPSGKAPSRLVNRLRELCVEHAVPYDKIVGDGRRFKLVAKRHTLMLLMHNEFPEQSFPQLGRLFNRDHSSVIYGINKARAKALPE